MSKRILNIHLYRLSNQLMMRFIYLYPIDIRVTKTESYNFTQEIIREVDDIGEVLEFYWSNLNHFDFFEHKLLGIEPNYYFKNFYFDSQFNVLSSDDGDKWLADQGRLKFSCHEIGLELPQTNIISLLKRLIGLDPFMRDFIFKLDSPCDLQVNYIYSAPSLTHRIPSYVSKLMSDPSAKHVNNTEKLFFSRIVATWLISELSDQSVITCLQNLLASNQKTLTQAIRETLYPESSVHYFILNNCTFYKEDKAMPALFNPNIPCKQAVDILRQQLNSNTDDKLTPSHWFSRYSMIRQSLWTDMIYTAIGKAINEDIYTNINTEIQLLTEATMSLSSEGDMQLHFTNTTTYKNYYDKSRAYHDVLEQELRTLCALLELQFLPDQDFHAETVRFDQQSTVFLKDRGFHITENDCKGLVHSPNINRMFTPGTTGPTPPDTPPNGLLFN